MTEQNVVDASSTVQASLRPPVRTGPRPRIELDDESERQIEAELAGLGQESLADLEARRDRPAPPPESVTQPGLKRGRVLSVRNEYIFVDLGGKSAAVLPVEQFDDEIPAVGSLVDVFIDRYDPTQGVLVLRRPTAAQSFDWNSLQDGMVIDVRVTAANKGGLEVDVAGVRGFVPASQVDIYRVAELTGFVGQTIRCLVAEVQRSSRNVLLSRRAVLEKEKEDAQRILWAELEEGQTRTGTVRNVREFGAFVDLGGVDGLLPIREMSWSRVEKPEDVVRVGQQIQVKVLKIDRETRKLTLGLKQLQTSPWDEAIGKYPLGTDIPARVTRVMDFGAFAELEPGIEGLIHISEMATQHVRRVRDIVKEDQQVVVRVMKVDPESKRIALSLKAIAVAAQKAAEAAATMATAEEPEPDAPPSPKPVRKVPLRGGLGR